MKYSQVEILKRGYTFWTDEPTNVDKQKNLFNTTSEYQTSFLILLKKVCCIKSKLHKKIHVPFAKAGYIKVVSVTIGIKVTSKTKTEHDFK